VGTGPEPSARLIQLGSIASTDDDLGALLVEDARDREPDAGAAARDDGDAARRCLSVDTRRLPGYC
jgi:hypothetical protein